MKIPLLSYLAAGRLEAGCDEAGRGCLAGPVFAAAVILPSGFHDDGLNDSKKISETQRDRLRRVIEREAIAWSVSSAIPEEIDKINILNASILAMHRAVSQLSLCPEYLLIDGNRFHPYPNIPHQCIIQGDGKYASIAAASVLAKTHRDEYMHALDRIFPMYHWKENKGYPTKEHRNAIETHGSCPHHRMTFRLTGSSTKNGQ